MEIVIIREEEIGFTGAKNLDYSLTSAKRGVLVDMDAIDAIVIGGPSHMLIDIEITGKGVHSGMEPEKGIETIPIGNGVKSEHTSSENVSVEDMKKVVQVLQHILNQFA